MSASCCRCCCKQEIDVLVKTREGGDISKELEGNVSDPISLQFCLNSFLFLCSRAVHRLLDGGENQAGDARLPGGAIKENPAAKIYILLLS